MCNRKSYARTSSSPGKTQTINYYKINDSFYFVDLPGYGYAKVSKADRAKWGKMIEDYLHTSSALKAIFLLIDIRHEPSENDKNMYDWIVQNGFYPIVIATKADKLKRSQLQKHTSMVRRGLGVPEENPVIPFSSESKLGKEEVLTLLESYL